MYSFFEKVSDITKLPCLYVRYTHQPKSSSKCIRLLVVADHDLLVVNGNTKFYNKASKEEKLKLICFIAKHNHKIFDYFKKCY